MTVPVQTDSEAQFNKWYSSWATQLRLNPNPDDPRHFYDYRAAFRAGAKPDSTGHWPSAYKREGHPNLFINGIDTRIGNPMTIPVPPKQLPDADLWEYYRARGLSVEDATLHVNRRRGTQTGKPPASLPFPTKGQSALVGATQGATSGFADELVGALSAVGNPNIPLTGEGVGGEIAKVRDVYGAARAAHPVVAGAANVAGSFANPLARVLPAPTNAARGAVAGTALGGVQGLGEGGGSLMERLPVAGVGAVTGAITGAALGKLVGKFAPVAQKAWTAVMRRLGKKVPTAQAQQAAEAAAEAAVRTSLQKAQQPPEVIEQVIQAMRQGKQIPTAQAPTSMRPGETTTPMAPSLERATFFRRGGTVQQQTSPISGNRSVTMRTMPDIGTGKTLPYWSRGGRVEQALGGPAPAQSAGVPAVGNQAQPFIDFLKASTPQNLAERIATLRAIGVSLPQDAEAQIARMLFGAQ